MTLMFKWCMKKWQGLPFIERWCTSDRNLFVDPHTTYFVLSDGRAIYSISLGDMHIYYRGVMK